MSGVAIAGAGLGGSLMAVALGQAGSTVDVYERRPDPRRAGATEGRSINLALSTRGLEALATVGLRESILEMAVPMRGRMMHAVSGALTFQPYGTERGHVIHSVSRARLNMTMVEAAERHPRVRVHFDQRVAGVDLARGVLQLADGSESPGEIVIGADGAFSAVRAQMMKLDRFDYSQSYLDHGYKELSIPAGPGGSFAMEPGALHIWPRGGFMMIALPNRDGSFTCTLFYPQEGERSFAALRTAADVGRFFAETFPDAVPLMPHLADEFFANPTGSLVTVRCHPWHVGGRVVLLGDAAHAVVPFYGQGANAAFEDCVVLGEAMAAHGPDWGDAFAEYETRRKPNADALATLAVENFHEMRDHVASRRFLVWKRTEKLLHRLFPRWFVPLYSMVTFSRMPYAEAVLRSRRQDRALRWLGAGLLGVLAAVLLLSWWTR